MASEALPKETGRKDRPHLRGTRASPRPYRTVSGPQRKKPAIVFTDDAKAKAIASLRQFSAEHLDEEFGDLKGMLLLDHVLAELGPTI